MRAEYTVYHSLSDILFYCCCIYCDLILNCYVTRSVYCNYTGLWYTVVCLEVWMLSYCIALVNSTRGCMWLKKFPFHNHLLRFDVVLVMELEMTTSIKHSVKVALAQWSRSHQSAPFRPYYLHPGKYLGFIQTCYRRIRCEGCLSDSPRNILLH